MLYCWRELFCEIYVFLQVLELSFLGILLCDNIYMCFYFGGEFLISLIDLKVNFKNKKKKRKF